MSMMGSFRQVSPGVLARLREEPALVEAALEFGEEPVSPPGRIAGFSPPPPEAIERMPKALRAAFEQAFAPRGPNALEGAGFTSDALPEPLEIEKAWHGLHFLLCRDVGVTSDPLSQVVMGGEELGEDLGYGPARVLEPAQVASLATALEGLSQAELEKNFAPEAMDEIYPSGWSSSGPEELEWLLDAFRDVRDYYVEARERGFGMLLYLT